MASAPRSSPRVPERVVDLLLDHALDAASLCARPAFGAHARETFDPWLGACRRLARVLRRFR